MPVNNQISSVNESAITEIQHYGPVTALKLHHNHIIVGYGPTLKIFQVDKNDQISLISTQRAFKRNKIHSIGVLDNGKIALAGGRSLAVTEIGNQNEIHEKSINEWIVACEFLEESRLLILTSHNEVLKVNIESTNFSVEEKIHCDEKSILYSGSIKITNSGKIYVAAGTVMSGVMIWDLESREILHVLTAHEGSIFGVKISGDGKYIVSCSDDRSVKLFEFESGKVLATGWGHGSRIWSLEFVSTSNNSVSIFSTGEDCTARLWKYENGNEILIQAHLWDHCHLGKHIWSGDVDSETLGASVTGGADGKLRVHDISGLESGVSNFSPEKVIQQTGAKFEKKEIFKQFAVLPNALIMVTSFGQVVTYLESTHQWARFELTQTEQLTIKQSGMLQSFPLLNAAAIFTSLGDMLCFNFSESGEINHLEWIKDDAEPRKVINVLVAEDSKRSDYYALLHCPNPNVPFELRKLSLINGNLAVAKSVQLCRPDPKVFIPTSAHFNTKTQWFLVGSRHANFAVYNLNGESYQLPLLVRKVCPGDTVTSISSVHALENHLIALLTVRDGTYVYLSIRNEDKFEFEVVVQNKVSRGVIEGGFVQNNDLYLYGFRSSAFYLWNETKQIEIDHHVCGGAHRQWKFVQGRNTGTFAYFKNNDLILKNFKLRFEASEYGLLIEGTHGREIRGLSISPVTEADGTKLVATASEDATVKLSKLHKSGNITPLWTLNNHISGLQTIEFLDHEYLVSSAANEELLIWKLSRHGNLFTTIVEHARLESSEEFPDLRIMDFSSISMNGGFWVAAAYSNSQIKIFYYNKAEKQFTLCVEDTYSTFCILNVHFIQKYGQSYLVTGTTDGYVTIWDVTSKLSTSGVSKLNNPVVHQQLHQSGIKALSVSETDNSTKIVTGGDDNALILSEVKFEPEVTLLVLSFQEEAASATITSLSLTDSHKVVATSVDQIVRVWNIAETLKLESASYTTVADTGCSDTTEIEGKKFSIVGGAGLGIWELN